ncbi:MAG: hypothetical protein QT05_C0004G0023 [archaeon GW2011_AR13]|nr:MAG: hypothetical protein QT05_C0004G0023 [archaeon GW2011_AR13]HIG94368.1 hypothetical protein [Nanoarchaeota archaeon]HIH63662.1 hypothetical protein [Nanoarchaeota archaeon]HIJ10083.1 hypothetical protein [Nanoarchaeota archaeon]
MKIKITKKIIYNIILVVAIFWFADFLMHIHGVGESNYYYILKFGNATLLAFIWFTIFDNKEHYKKALFAIFAGTWISFSYLMTSYSGFIQLLGISARYNAPPFVILGLTLSPYFWWLFHSLVFYIGLEISKFFK